MNSKDLRSERRVPISRRATLAVGDSTFPCMILDMSENGVLIMASRPFAVGQVLGLRCEVSPGAILECKIEIRHTGEDGTGARIVEVDEKGAKLCRLLLQEHFSDRLSRSK